MVCIKEMSEEIVDVLIFYKEGGCPYCGESQRYYQEWDDDWFYECPNGHKISGYLELDEPYVQAISEIKERYNKRRSKNGRK